MGSFVEFMLLLGEATSLQVFELVGEAVFISKTLRPVQLEGFICCLMEDAASVSNV